MLARIAGEYITHHHQYIYAMVFLLFAFCHIRISYSVELKRHIYRGSAARARARNAL